MSWELILKKRGRNIAFNYPLFKEAVEEATNTHNTFTLSEIIPSVKEIYQEKLIADGMPQAGAELHAEAKLQGGRLRVLTRTINNIGLHKKTSRKKNGEFLFVRIGVE